MKERKVTKTIKQRAEEYIAITKKQKLDRFIGILGGESGLKKQAYPESGGQLGEFTKDGLVYNGIGETEYALSTFGRRVARLHIRNQKYEISGKYPPPEYRPPKKGKPGDKARGVAQRVTAYPYNLLNVGDSFFVPETYENPYPIERMRGAVCAQNNYWRDKDGNVTKWYVCKEWCLAKHGMDGVRVWRVQ